MPTILSQPTDQLAKVAVLEETRGLVMRALVPLTTTYAADVRKEILAAWDEKKNPQSVVLDLGEVSQIDSTGVGALLELSQRARAAGIPLVLTNLRTPLRTVFDRTRVISTFGTADTIEDALNGDLTYGPAGGNP